MLYYQSMELDEQRDKITEELKLLNEKMSTQNSVRHIFFTGVIYGIGFFIGSAIIATIAFGTLSPWVGKIDWVRDNFERGASLR
jgi:hypothetical protein